MFTHYATQKILDSLFGRAYYLTLATNCYIGLSTTTPTTEGANFTEPAASSGYARVPLGLSASEATFKMYEQADGSYANHDPDASISQQAIAFPPVSVSWGTITHFGIFDAASGGNLIAFGELTTPVTVDADYVAVFNDNALTFTLS